MILITGGAGYIGSHTCVALLQAGYDIVVLDNFCNSQQEALTRVKEITQKDFPFYQTDIRDEQSLTQIFQAHPIEAVIHFAGLKAVGESTEIPLDYYHNNVGGTLSLCKVMAEQGVKTMVFSSSATVYGDPEQVPIPEEAKLQVTNPYGRTKLMIEDILRDLQAADPQWRIALLRYFNPVGAHESGRIGENPNGIPNNLMPRLLWAAAGKIPALTVYGDDYPTPDGTGVRDYIHVMDLAQGHVKAIAHIQQKPGIYTYNLGTGKGYSVYELIKAFEQAANIHIPWVVTPRRPGDIPLCYADPGKAKQELGWEATRDLADMCLDTWRWFQQNPQGY